MLEDGPTSQARVVETHISLLVFVADRVYKLRKPVRFDFLDFTDRAVREADCHREVELNRRLAPDVYLGVADIVMDGMAIDHMVVMRALPERRRLATLVQGQGELDVDVATIGQVAATVAAFHAGAPRSAIISASATAETIGATWDMNLHQVSRFVGPILAPEVDAEIRSLAQSWLRRHGQLLDERIAAGRVCDGHGDLQAEDVFCLDDGVRIIDCIEFSDALRHADVCADAAFLAMDLERLGRRDLAELFIRTYEDRSGDRFPKTLLHFYIAQRAYVRAEVACLREEQGDDDAIAAARQLHALALHHLRRTRPVVVLVGGLPGSGKSTLAAGLAAATGWALLRTDEIRREVGLGENRYDASPVAAVYRELLRRAREHLERGQGVVLDATWVSGATRADATRVAEECESELVELCCRCDDDVATARIGARKRGGTDASDATRGVRALLAARMDPWPAAHLIDTSEGSVDEEIVAALALVEGR